MAAQSCKPGDQVALRLLTTVIAPNRAGLIQGHSSDMKHTGAQQTESLVSCVHMLDSPGSMSRTKTAVCLLALYEPQTRSLHVSEGLAA